MESALSRYCNSPVTFDDNASKEEVIKGIKNFAAQVKQAMELGRSMI